MASNPTPVPTAAPTNKTVAATAGSVFGAAVAVILLYFTGNDGLPEHVKAAIITVVTAIITGASGYFTPPGSHEAVVTMANGATRAGKVVRSPE
jgi:hypothetical protein